MPRKVSTCVSHIVLAGTTSYCVYHFRGSGTALRMPNVAFGVVLTHSLLGILKWGREESDENVDKAHDFFQFLRSIAVMPCIAGQVWLDAGYQKEAGYAHAALAVIPFAGYLADKNKQEIVDAILLIACVSCGVVSFNKDNRYGIAAAVIYLLNHFGVKEENEIMEIPAEDFYNYALAVFMWTASRAIGLGSA